jgi:uncharacterized protein YggE
MKWIRHATAFLAVALLVAASRVRAQESTAPAGGGISVSGSGEVKAKPNVVEINASVTGDAELAADAIVKYRDARRRAVEALNGLKLEGLKVESGGFSVNQGVDPASAQAMMQGNAAPAAKSRVNVSEQLKLVLSGLDKVNDEELMDTVLKILDTGRDAGLQIGKGSPRNYYEMQMYMNEGGGSQKAGLVVFKLKDPESLREKAYKQAMDNVRKNGERLAGLAGVKLGRISSVRDTAAAGAQKDELTSPVYKEISVKVNLAAQYEIAK